MIKEPIQSSESTEPNLIGSNPEPIVDVSLRRSDRVSCQSDRSIIS